MGKRDGYVFVGNQVLQCEIDAAVDNLSPPFVRVILLHGPQLFDDDTAKSALVRENVLKLSDLLCDLLSSSASFWRSSAASLRAEMSRIACLKLGELELRLEAQLASSVRRRRPDELDDRVEHVKSSWSAFFEYVGPRLCLPQLVARPVAHHLAPGR
jgi:hypothetical protein